MATFTATNASDYLVPLYGDRGNVYCVTGTYDVDSSMTSGDVIELTKLPGGAQPLPSYVQVDEGTWNIGYSGNATLWGSASSDGFLAPSSPDAIGSGGEEVVVKATCTAAPTASGTLTAYIFYKLIDID